MEASDKLERAALEALHSLVSKTLQQQLGLVARDVEGAYVSIASKLPASAIVINRCIGSGLSGSSPEALAEIIRSYQDSGVARYFFQCYPEQGLDSSLLELGLKQARAWQKFELARDDFKVRRSSHSIEMAPPAPNQDFGRIICNAFDLGDDAQAWLAKLPVHPNWKLFLALIDGQIAGVGGLYIEGNLAWLDFGATAPEFRCRGCQSALLSARLEYAFANGCERAFTCTGVDVAGDPQHSYKNILKAGFRPSVVRENYSAD